MEGNTHINSGGMSFIGILTLIFIVLKLTGNVNWSWLWVFSPIWISASFTIGIVLTIAIGTASFLWWQDEQKK